MSGPALVPFRALRYDDPNSDEDGVLTLDTVIAPATAPDDADLRAELAAASGLNIVNGLTDPALLRQWTDDGWMAVDGEASMYLYKIGFTDIEGRPAQWTGVFALTGEGPDAFASSEPRSAAQIVPARIAVSAEGFTDLLVPVGMPLSRGTDSRGAHHRLWSITQAGVLALISEAVEAKGEPRPERLHPGTLVLVAEATQPEYGPALGLVVAC